MKKFLLTTLATALACGSALAADMAPAYKAPPPPPPAPVYNWTGVYVGGALGYALWDADTTATNTTTGVETGVQNNGGRGWMGEAVLGYDYQFAIANWNLVAGVFANYDFGNAKGKMDANTAVTALGSIVGSESEKSAWYLGARAGWLVTPQILSYWTGGYTETHFDGVTFVNSGTATVAPMAIPSHTYHGWFLGGGVEAQSSWLPGLSFNTEYRFASYGRTTMALSNAPAVVGFPANLNVRPYVQTVMSGVRYKFNWPH